MSGLETFDVPSLEAFTSGLVAAGFEPVPGSDRRLWKGRTPAAFDGLTSTKQMFLMIRDGWPYQSPVVFVEGLHTNHVTAAGYVCLWHDGDSSGDWLTVEGLFARIDEWCEQAKSGWDRSGLARDAYLNFTRKLAAVVTYDLDKLHLGNTGAWGALHASSLRPGLVDLAAGTAPASALAGLWFHVRHVEVPPRNLAELRAALNRVQRRGLDRAIAERDDVPALQRSGGVDLIAFRWDAAGVRHMLVLALTGSRAETEALVLQDGAIDEHSLLLRAGPAAPALRGCRVVMFGLGAIGGHAAVCLASSGLGNLRLVDSDLLVPGNVVRHVVGHSGVGGPKTHGVEATILEHAPWTGVETVLEAPATPTRLRELVEDTQVVVDATGTEAVTGALAAIAAASARPLVSGALFRGGAVGRVRRQGTPGDVPLSMRGDAGYALIPPAGDEEFVEPEVGCSAPTNNAPPASVLACAALLAQAVVDVLSGALELPDEMIDVYRPLVGEPPYDVVGRVR